MVGGDAPRICLNAVGPEPVRAAKAEAVVSGKKLNKISEKDAEAAGEAAVADAKPTFKAARFKVQIARTLVKRAILSLT